MSFAQYKEDGTHLHAPAALSKDGKVVNAGFDTVESVQKVAMMVWNPSTLSWVRATASNSSGGSSSGTTNEVYTRRIDAADPSTIYVGEAMPGTLETESGWVIRKNTFDTNGNPTATYIASGIWNDRSSLIYQ